MSTLTSLGIGSGLDVNSIVTQLMQVERAPLDQLDTKQAGVKSKISAFGTISSALSTLKDAAATLADPSKLAGYQANFADSSVATGTATGTAAAGTYSINVKQLATAHKVASNTLFTGISQKVGEGRFSLDVGGTAKQIETGPNATLGDLRDAINNAGAGVTANLISSDGGTKLVLTATDTGKKISVAAVQDLNGGDGADFVGLVNGFTTVGGPHTVTTNTAFSGPSEQVGTGTLNITVGSTTTPIAIGGANATLQDVSDAINGAAAGVTASIVTDATGTRLQLTSTDPDKLVSYSAVDDNATDGLEFTKLRGFSTVGANPQVPQQAIVEIDGQTVTSNSNAISTAIGGVTLNLAKTGSTSFTVARDNSGITTAVNTFVSAYNALNSKLKSLSAYDAANKTGSELTGDSTLRAIQNQVSSLVFGTGGSANAIDTLSDLGISFSSNGNIAADSGKLAKNISANFDAVVSTLSDYGTQFKKMATNMTAANGMLTTRTEGLNKSIKDFTTRRESLELRMTAIEKRYRTQYSSLDSIVASMQQTSSFLSQQLAKM